jgi:dTDP-4-amino-4,6-dideoxygalactose transaminase
MLRTHGGKDKYNVSLLGHNSRLDTIQASILAAKLKHVDFWTEGRRRVAKMYTDLLSGVGDLILPIVRKPEHHVWHQYTVRTKDRDALKEFLREKGVETTVYYPIPLHLQLLFGKHAKISGELTNSEEAAKTVLSLPIDPLQTEEGTEFVGSSIKEFYRK